VCFKNAIERLSLTSALWFTRGELRDERLGTGGVTEQAVRNMLQGHEGCTHVAGAPVFIRPGGHRGPLSNGWKRSDRSGTWMVRSSSSLLPILRNAASDTRGDQTCNDIAEGARARAIMFCPQRGTVLVRSALPTEIRMGRCGRASLAGLRAYDRPGRCARSRQVAGSPTQGSLIRPNSCNDDAFCELRAVARSVRQRSILMRSGASR